VEGSVALLEPVDEERGEELVCVIWTVDERADVAMAPKILARQPNGAYGRWHWFGSSLNLGASLIGVSATVSHEFRRG
jgi:hypothetical protein